MSALHKERRGKQSEQVPCTLLHVCPGTIVPVLKLSKVTAKNDFIVQRSKETAKSRLAAELLGKNLRGEGVNSRWDGISGEEGHEPGPGEGKVLTRVVGECSTHAFKIALQDTLDWWLTSTAQAPI